MEILIMSLEKAIVDLTAELKRGNDLREASLKLAKENQVVGHTWNDLGQKMIDLLDKPNPEGQKAVPDSAKPEPDPLAPELTPEVKTFSTSPQSSLRELPGRLELLVEPELLEVPVLLELEPMVYAEPSVVS